MSIKEEYLQELNFEDNDDQTHVIQKGREITIMDSDSDDEFSDSKEPTLDIYDIIIVLDNMRQHCEIVGLDWLNTSNSLEELMGLLNRANL